MSWMLISSNGRVRSSASAASAKRSTVSRLRACAGGAQRQRVTRRECCARGRDVGLDIFRT
jgi:cytidylate kinase